MLQFLFGLGTIAGGVLAILYAKDGDSLLVAVSLAAAIITPLLAGCVSASGGEVVRLSAERRRILIKAQERQKLLDRHGSERS